MTKEEFLKLPPIIVEDAGQLRGLIWVGKGNVYAGLADAHGDNFLISTGIKADGTFSLDIEGCDWVEVEEGLGPNGALV